MVAYFYYAQYRVNKVFRCVEGIWLQQKCRQIWSFFSRIGLFYIIRANWFWATILYKYHVNRCEVKVKILVFKSILYLPEHSVQFHLSILISLRLKESLRPKERWKRNYHGNKILTRGGYCRCVGSATLFIIGKWEVIMIRKVNQTRRFLRDLLKGGGMGT